MALEQATPRGHGQPRMSGDDRRRQLIEVAIDLFSKNGFAGTTTKEIAAAAGVTEAIIFRHFATKQDLYKAILDHKCGQLSIENWMDEAQALMDADDDTGLFRFLIGKMISFARDDTKFSRLLTHAALEGHELAIMHHDQLAMPIGTKFKDYIARRQAAGAIRGTEPGIVLLALAGAGSHYANQKYVYRQSKFPGGDDDRVIEGLVRIFQEGLLTQPGPNGKGRG